jgi:hypothetical protein
MPVIGCDGEQGGVCKEIWVDTAEPQVRYLETRCRREARAAPMPLCNVRGKKGIVEVESITGAQFKDAPTLKSYDQITLAEEDKSRRLPRCWDAVRHAGPGGALSVSEFDFEPVPGLPEAPP